MVEGFVKRNLGHQDADIKAKVLFLKLFYWRTKCMPYFMAAIQTKKILLIENDPSLLGLLTLELELQDFSVRAFVSAEEALIAQFEPPTLVIVDYHLLGIDGLVLLQRLRWSYSDLPALVISSECRWDQIPSGANLPATHLLSKPFTQYAFLNVTAYSSFRQGLPESSCHGGWHRLSPALAIHGTGFSPDHGENDGRVSSYF